MEKIAVIADGVTPRQDDADKPSIKQAKSDLSDPIPNRGKDGFDDDLAKRAADVVADRRK